MNDRFKTAWLAVTAALALSLFAGGCTASKQSDGGPGQTANPASSAVAADSRSTDVKNVSQIFVKPASVVLPPVGDSSAKAFQPLEIDGVLDKQNQIILYNGTDKDEMKAANPKDFAFTSSNPDVVTVNKEGIISVSPKAVTGDTAKVTVRYADKSAECLISIKYSLQQTLTTGPDGLAVVTNPADPAVVVNKQRGLPADYIPMDLVQPHVPFSFAGDSEKKHLRKAAANALEQLFAAAKKDGIELFGVSGYRSYRTQQTIFSYNVKHQGEEEARRFSAQPGHSEHQTGLAIDVSSQSAKFGLEETFGDTVEGKWLASHAHEFGFIIRYPKGKEESTGYAYEPWHIRYVGKQIAEQIYRKNWTLEEFFSGTLPASNS
ncbi:D-alanyl-D-alanine carboxypeptidase family protein [Ferviditalea candida]|uniref:M15 family metallopeptidase n=1 Tax=Ferviditalea candida TaxID=3108399 RepID=A0ABU5ZKS2_9BACL|nr:M15 family metallopeptidase [Paenibacillaceae bacterium T2]